MTSASRSTCGNKTNYCGIVSGKKVDKSRLFDVFYGSLPGAPLIRECPVSMACRLNQTVKRLYRRMSPPSIDQKTIR